MKILKETDIDWR